MPKCSPCDHTPGHNRILSAEEIKSYPTFGLAKAGDYKMALAKTEKRVKNAGVWSDAQVLGKRYAIGCVALEITQRCNLDCTLCYLSENSEQTKDIPIQEVFRRIEQIYNHYGPGTDVQVTGGDPTLRDETELLEIVSKIRKLKMRPTLMTNGLKATRALLVKLVAAGLHDVAFHVDMTQERKPYKSEAELNKIRLMYIERARGLPLHVIFNTTVFDGNFHELPDLIRFFRAHSDVVQFASFQLQADTGRGFFRKREDAITVENVWARIEAGAGTLLPFGALQVGHTDCNRYCPTIAVNGNLYPLLDDPQFIRDFVDAADSIELNRARPAQTILNIGKWAMGNPKLLSRGLKFIAPKLWNMKRDLAVKRGKVGKLTFFVHNFMDAKSLECDRIESCSFMVMTHEGPISMCMHNAKRDSFILKPLQIQTERGETQVFKPLDDAKKPKRRTGIRAAQTAPKPEPHQTL